MTLHVKMEMSDLLRYPEKQWRHFHFLSPENDNIFHIFDQIYKDIYSLNFPFWSLRRKTASCFQSMTVEIQG